MSSNEKINKKVGGGSGDRTDKEDKRIQTMAQAPPAKAVVSMGVPLIVGMFIMVFYNLVDTFFIGLLRDDYQLAAVNLAYPVMMITIALANMVGTGGSSLIARCLGAEKKDKANQALTTALILTVVTGLVITAAGLILLGPIVQGLGAREHTSIYTADYVRILLIGTVFTMGNYTVGQLLRSEGSVKYSILGMIAGTVANILLDPLFIFTLGMEIRGAALATILGNAIGMGISMELYRSGRTMLRPRREYLRLEGAIVREIYWVGVPAALETLLTSVAFIVMNHLAVGYGELTVAAMGIAQKLLSLGNYIYQGFAAGVQPIMGYNYGARNYRRMLEILKAGVLIVSGTELCVMLIYGIFAPNLIGLFTDSGEVIRTGTAILRALMCILPFVGATSMCRMSFQAMGKPFHAFGITVVRQLVLYIPLLLLLNRWLGFYGLIWAQPITEVIMMIVSIWLLRRNIIRAQRLERRG